MFREKYAFYCRVSQIHIYPEKREKNIKKTFCDVGLPSLTLKVRSNDNIEMVFQFSSSSSIHSTNLNFETVHLWGIWSTQ